MLRNTRQIMQVMANGQGIFGTCIICGAENKSAALKEIGFFAVYDDVAPIMVKVELYACNECCKVLERAFTSAKTSKRFQLNMAEEAVKYLRPVFEAEKKALEAEEEMRRQRRAMATLEAEKKAKEDGLAAKAAKANAKEDGLAAKAAKANATKTEAPGEGDQNSGGEAPE